MIAPTINVERIREIKALLEKASPGKQEIRNSYQVGTYREPEGDEPGAVWQPVASCSKEGDAEFFAQAHVIVSELLVELGNTTGILVGILDEMDEP